MGTSTMERITKHEQLKDSMGTPDPAKPEKPLYAHELRVVGQALESRHVYSLDLELEGGLYVVRGRVKASSYAESSLSAFIQDLISGVGSAMTGSPRRSMYEIDLSYNPKDIKDLDSKGRALRRSANQNPDPYSLAQKLRGIGSFLDYQPETTLAGVSVEDRWVTVRYLTADGRMEEAKQDVAYFYEYWVKMYLRRSQRASGDFPDNPALQVAWEKPSKHEVLSRR
jgi:hypothetical protein